ncbi:DNA-binding transcriptional MerR regulator [Rhodopirellula rubra]|uniref:DNA-binding transcriptional MerR regulator n=1 Tax=Aporhodopirellula rubra TaxID=980271 RepID=A0A7W5DZ51_9BACT|nr:MerR family DNA-binding transcriptional regulator [Aporhodopirellula rubra]MBB3206788.1 DNA-binding transcriptional MerR regulator [Aporhodopirellula rubra]
MADQQTRSAFEGMIRVGLAAEFLGVSAETLRNWDKSGRLVPTRNPVTGYRYYERQQLERFLARAIAEREVPA